MRTILTGATGFALAVFAWGAQPANTPAKKTTTRPSASPPAAVHKAAVVSTASAAKKPVSATPVRTAATPQTAVRKPAPKRAPIIRTTWRNRQAAPTADRYKEIQFALAARGYLPADGATGIWDQASADALKKFQTDQNIDNSGKISALSLIALGLGPRHDSPPVKIADNGSSGSGQDR